MNRSQNGIILVVENRAFRLNSSGICLWFVHLKAVVESITIFVKRLAFRPRSTRICSILVHLIAVFEKEVSCLNKRVKTRRKRALNVCMPIGHLEQIFQHLDI